MSKKLSVHQAYAVAVLTTKGMDQSKVHKRTWRSLEKMRAVKRGKDGVYVLLFGVVKNKKK